MIDTKCLKSAYESAILYLNSRSVPNARQDAWMLLEDTCKCTRSSYFVHPERTLTEEEAQLYAERVRRRGERIPLQQILGTAWFYGLEFHVTDQVLCPRQDTEVLVEETLKFLQNRPGPKRVLDLCTGSGCILAAVLHECPEAVGVGVDLSENALKIAAENTAFLGERAALIHSDLFSQVQGTFSVLVSNPPYIRTSVIGGLMEEVRDHEPMMALDGGEDGLDFYRRILREAPEYLEDGACVLFEIGYDQGRDLKELFKAHGYTDVRILPDLAGLDRVAMGIVPDRA